MAFTNYDRSIAGVLRDVIVQATTLLRKETELARVELSENVSRAALGNDDDYDVLAEGVVVGRIFKANAAPVGSPWMWTLAFGQHEDRAPTHGYGGTREAAMAAFAKSWRRECRRQKPQG
jgi:hypothetical protein